MLDVKKHPNKPVYEMASEVPLILYDCNYEDVKFIQKPGTSWRINIIF